MKLDIQTISHGELKFSNDLPPRYPGPRLPGGMVLYAIDKFGNFCIQEFYGGSFIIRHSVFDILEDFTVRIKSLFSGLNTIIMQSNHLEASIKDAGPIKLLEGQFTIIQANEPEATITFKGNQRYETFETLYHPQIVEDVFSDFPTIADSLVKESAPHPTILVNPANWTNEEIRENVDYIINYAEDKKWRRSYFGERVRDILLQFMIIVNKGDLFEGPVKGRDVEIVYTVQKIILENLSEEIIIREMAQKVNTSESKLKRVFKNIVGKTLLGFRTEHRLKNAFKLINEKGLSVKEVAAATGWSSSYLIRKYKDKYETTPGSANPGKNKP